MALPERLTNAQYRRLLRECPAPTRAQMEAFARFASHAHSWYKHLPLAPPKVPFHFFLDPAAGMEWSWEEGADGGRLRVAEREERGFHYAMIPTAEYRRRFGHLAYAADAGTTVTLERGSDTVVPSDRFPCVGDPRTGTVHLLPDDALRAGAAFVSGLVHVVSLGSAWLWGRTLKRHPEVDWPEESGGRATWEAMRERCRELRADEQAEDRTSRDDERLARDPVLRLFPEEYPYLGRADFELYRLQRPECHRQRRAMVDAMERAVEQFVGFEA